jgi:hypothetical protein
VVDILKEDIRNQSQKQVKTCGNCAFSKEVPQTSMDDIPDPKQVKCKKDLPMAGIYHDIDDEYASNCKGYEAKEN